MTILILLKVQERTLGPAHLTFVFSVIRIVIIVIIVFNLPHFRLVEFNLY